MTPDLRPILIVEDEALIAMQLEDMLDSSGYGPVVLASSVAEASDMIEASELKAALVDISLSGEPIWPVADRLVERGVPFILCSGGFGGLPAAHAGLPKLAKPYALVQLRDALASIGIIRD